MDSSEKDDLRWIMMMCVELRPPPPNLMPWQSRRLCHDQVSVPVISSCSDIKSLS